jgi:predicted O-linked N-acetylglucosamine transferase (SPINDLY family)
MIFSHLVNPGDNLIRIQACDVHLDSWPYNAHSTGMDVLWAGVPMLVYLSDYHDEQSEKQVPKMSSRVSASLLHTLGMPQLIMPTIEAFEDEAVRLSMNREAYTELRNELLAKRLTSPLFDLISYARVHEKAYDYLFQVFADGISPKAVDIPPYIESNQSKPTAEKNSKDEL